MRAACRFLLRRWARCLLWVAWRAGFRSWAAARLVPLLLVLWGVSLSLEVWLVTFLSSVVELAPLLLVVF